MKVYVAASFAYSDKDKTAQRKQDIEGIVNKIKTKYVDCFDFYLPHQLKIVNAWDYSLETWANMVFTHDIEALNDSDLVIFISYGKENNAGAVWECGYAFAKQIPVIVIKMTDYIESLMVTSSAHAIITQNEISQYDFYKLPQYKTVLHKIS